MKADKFTNAKTKLKKTAVVGGIVVAGLIGGKMLVDNKKENNKETTAVEMSATFASYREKLKPITAYLIADLIVKEGVHIDRKGKHAPYRCSRGIPTIGFGSTMLKDGTRVTMKTEPITTDEAYELARWHIEDGETYFLLYCYDIACKKIDVNTTEEALGMGSIIFNSGSNLLEKPKNKNHRERNTTLRKIYKEYGFALPDSLVLQCFAKYPILEPTKFGEAWFNGEHDEKLANKLGEFLAGGRGLYWRRWLEAGLLTGRITPKMLFNCPSGGMFEFFKVMRKQRSAFFTGKVGQRKVNTDTYALFEDWLKKPVNEKGQSLAAWKKVKDWLPADVLRICENGKCELGQYTPMEPTEKQKTIEIKTYVLGYDELYARAVAAHKSGDYKLAAKKFEGLVKDYPDNALLRNDLSDTYNKLGRYNDAIVQAREIVLRIGDKSQYVAANYNAGFAYERLGNLQKALANYKLAVANGNRKVQKDVTRVINQINMQTKKTTPIKTR